MRPYFAVVLLLAGTAAMANPCTNGGFEEIDAAGQAVDWQPMGQVTIETGDVHSGEKAWRITRTGGEEYVETGFNRRWVPYSGEGGAMIGETKGGMEFWYKVPSRECGKVSFFVIPMNAEPFEDAGSRTEYVVPEDHKGDGQWHRARLKYDYAQNKDVKWVHFALRLLVAGEVLVDDFAYVPKVGPQLSIEGVRLEESADAPGERATLHFKVSNKGDVPVEGIAVQVAADGLAPVDRSVARLGIDAREWFAVPVAMRRVAPLDLHISAEAAGVPPAQARFSCEQALRLVNFGPVTPVAKAGESVGVEALLANEGNTIIPGPMAMIYSLGGVLHRGRLDADLPPGKRAILRGEASFPGESPAVSVALVRIDAGAVCIEGPAVGGLVVTGDADIPIGKPRRRGEMCVERAEGGVAWVGHAHAVVFPESSFGYGPARIYQEFKHEWMPALWMPRLSTIVHLDSSGNRHERVVYVAKGRAQDFEEIPGGLRVHWSMTDEDGANWRLAITLTQAGRDEQPATKFTYELTCDQDREILRFDGPMFYAEKRDEAIVPGVEWLIDDEISSSTLDIEEGHPHQVRYVPDTRMFTAPVIGLSNGPVDTVMTWSLEGRERAPLVQPVFASPDRWNHQRSHLFGLQIPSAPAYLDPNTREAARPYRLKAGETLTISCALRAPRSHQLARAMFDVDGVPNPQVMAPAPLPRGDYDSEIQFSMRGYFEGLWVPEENMWMTTKNGPPQMAFPAREPNTVADILLGALYSPDAKVRERCAATVAEHAGLLKRRPYIETLRYGPELARAVAMSEVVGGQLASRDSDGLWRFDADLEDPGIFKGMDYHLIGPDKALAVGTCADKARQILRHARVAGDWYAYEQMLPVLEYMETVRVPRAAQVWEVPFHTPDILAAADAMDCYMEAYLFSGEERWLEAARDWAFKGLPFIYMWQQPEWPFTYGGSIPVLGATWFSWSWFMRPVQWNGLRYADALLLLDEYDAQYDWRPAAESILVSALYQQATEGEDVGLWPDSQYVVDGEKSGWVFGPRMPLTTMMKLRGQGEVVNTTILGEGRARLHVSSLGEVRDAAWEGDSLRFGARFREGYAGFVMVSNVAAPRGVTVDGKPLAERPRLFEQDAPGWFYDPPRAFLSLQLGVGDHEVVIDGAAYTAVVRLAQPKAHLDFEFDGADVEGWTVANHIARLRAEAGALQGEITGGDPYMYRGNLTVDAGRYSGIELRLRVTGGLDAQIYWGTAADSAINEDRVAVFPITADGAFHTYHVPLAGHRHWDGQRIVTIRLDPGNGAAEAEFALDYLRGIE